MKNVDHLFFHGQVEHVLEKLTGMNVGFSFETKFSNFQK